MRSAYTKDILDCKELEYIFYKKETIAILYKYIERYSLYRLKGLRRNRIMNVIDNRIEYSDTES